MEMLAIATLFCTKIVNLYQMKKDVAEVLNDFYINIVEQTTGETPHHYNFIISQL